ncbi:MAG: hypothetical protein IJ859_00640 [Synergistaceae bacterium]|nr:hypothetical protein [Synergistaceae bacterium]
MVVDKFKITYDEVGRMGIDIHQLYSIFEANTELSFDEWWEYMKSSHLAENEDFINEWVTLEAAKDICQYEILRLAEEHDFADPIFFCYITEEMLSASEYAEKPQCQIVLSITLGLA